MTVEHLNVSNEARANFTSLAGLLTDLAESMSATRKATRETWGPIVEELAAKSWDKPLPVWHWKEHKDREVLSMRGKKVAAIRNTLLAEFAMIDATLQQEMFDVLPELEPDSEELTIQADDVARYIRAKGGKVVGRLKTVHGQLSRVMRDCGFWERKDKKQELSAEKLAEKVLKLDEDCDVAKMMAAIPFIAEGRGEELDWSEVLAAIPKTLLIQAGEKAADSLTPAEIIELENARELVAA